MKMTIYLWKTLQPCLTLFHLSFELWGCLHCWHGGDQSPWQSSCWWFPSQIQELQWSVYLPCYHWTSSWTGSQSQHSWRWCWWTNWWVMSWKTFYLEMWKWWKVKMWPMFTVFQVNCSLWHWVGIKGRYSVQPGREHTHYIWTNEHTVYNYIDQ